MKYIAILEDEHIVRIGDKPCLHCFNGLMNDYFIPVKERKAGKWVEVWDKDHIVILAYKCSECGTMRNTKTKYCADCGAEMESEDA